MIIKILRRERHCLEKTLAMLEMTGNFYTVENNENLVLCQFDATPEFAWDVARAFQAEVQCDQNPYIQ
jgi:hypothetical protein